MHGKKHCVGVETKETCLLFPGLFYQGHGDMCVLVYVPMQLYVPEAKKLSAALYVKVPWHCLTPEAFSSFYCNLKLKFSW